VSQYDVAGFQWPCTTRPLVSKALRPHVAGRSIASEACLMRFRKPGPHGRLPGMTFVVFRRPVRKTSTATGHYDFLHGGCSSSTLTTRFQTVWRPLRVYYAPGKWDLVRRRRRPRPGAPEAAIHPDPAKI